MANRPCKPDGDLKKLWQMLMPGVAMPVCGTGGDAAPPENETTESESAKSEAAKSESTKSSELAQDGTNRRPD
jgi:hypothetical protein